MAFWDNRVVAHRAVPGGYNPEEREGKRTAVYGERPFLERDNAVIKRVANAKGGTANGASEDTSLVPSL